MAKVNHAVLNATLVALVAIGGMVIYFGSDGGVEGAYNYDPRGVFKIGTFQGYYEVGDKQIGPQCVLTAKESSADWQQCCDKRCIEFCNSIGIKFDPKYYGLQENEFRNCGKGCDQGCKYSVIRAVSIGFDYKGVRDTTSEYRDSVE
ncbi:MAG: hypothetical protein AABX47_10825 [Nanoarchaeota archaeon]